MTKIEKQKIGRIRKRTAENLFIKGDPINVDAMRHGKVV